MSRYIDADKLIKKMERRYEEMRLKYGEYDHFNMGFAEAMVAVDNASAADVVEVVRCKDCIYGEVDEYGNTWCTFFNGKLREMPNGYCWHGERKEE